MRRANIPAADRALPGNRAVVVITWPAAPSVFSPVKFPEVAAFLTRLFAESATTLAAIKASKQL